MSRKLTFEQAIELVRLERAHQDGKWGPIEERQQGIPGFLLVLRKELIEAEDGWIKNRPGRNAALWEIVQVAATALAAIETHGGRGNGDEAGHVSTEPCACGHDDGAHSGRTGDCWAVVAGGSDCGCAKYSPKR